MEVRSFVSFRSAEYEFEIDKSKCYNEVESDKWKRQFLAFVRCDGLDREDALGLFRDALSVEFQIWFQSNGELDFGRFRCSQ